jgi:hypothetical protein
MRVASHRSGYEPDEIKVTPEMVKAGLQVLEKSGLVDDLMEQDASLVSQIYRAMNDKADRPNQQ